MKAHARAMVLASFAADSLALGVHWIYSTEKMAKDFGRVEEFLDPAPGSFHSTRKKGEFTHYGDQAFVLLESLAARGRFDPDDFSGRWQRLFQDYQGYYDQATRETLKNLSNGRAPLEAGSSSNDLSGASRIAPLVALLHDCEEDLAVTARVLTAMTHQDRLAVDAGEFFSRVCARVLSGASPCAALGEVAGERFRGTELEELVHAGMDSSGRQSLDAIRAFGKTCHAPEALPGVVHLICRYPDDLREALVQAATAGGDSAARGMAVGMVLGARLGEEAIPPSWVMGLKKAAEIEALLDAL